MRLSQLFGKTLRQEPAEAETASHRLMLRAGLIHPIAAGVYSMLPLGLRSYRKIERVIREEMDAAGGQELSMPALQPIELWQQTGRHGAFGQTLFTFQDRKERLLCLAPTHEEVVTTLVSLNVQSYRDLPQLLYQIQTKFRDEQRPRAGLIRVREFAMKDAYSFDVDADALDATYRRVFQAYKNIFARCGLPAVPVEADSGAIGGKDSQEFMLLAESGEDEILRCSGCGYAANVERAAFVKPPAPKDAERPLEKVATPGKKTIEEVAAFLGVKPEQTLKAVFHAADGKVVFVVIRGDLEVNEVKLRNALKCADLRLATDEEVRGAGLVAGYASPIGVKGVRVVGDDSIALGANFVAGANLDGHHYKNANYPRDFTVALLTDIAKARAGDTCARCGKGAFESMRGIEVGHVFKLGTIFSEKLGASFLDKDGQKKPIIMGCYGIGVGRLLAAAVEQNHDEKGIMWPAPIAPYHVHMVGLQLDNPQVGPAAEKLYVDLQATGLDVLFDDRAESPGVKFNDADLLGMPLRVTVSPRTLKTQSVELKRRSEAQARNVPLAEAVAAVRQAVDEASRAATGRPAA